MERSISVFSLLSSWLLLFPANGRDLPLIPEATPREGGTTTAGRGRRTTGEDVTCVDSPLSYADSDGYSCATYEEREWCTAQGDYGPGWGANWGTFALYGTNGIDASQACCSCGGGECVDRDSWADSYGDTCATYRTHRWCENDGVGSGWNDGWGDFATYAVDGHDASTACCGCGRGAEEILEEGPLSQVLQKYRSQAVNVTSLVFPNHLITGTVPDFIREFTALEELDLSGNKLSGSLPSAMGELSSLQTLTLSRTGLTGQLPPLPATLEFLNIPGNSFTGEWPEQWQLLVKLVEFIVADVPLRGPLLDWLRNFENLRSFECRNCNLDGTLPADIGNLRVLEKLELTSNKIQGTLPASIGQLTALQRLSLWDNQRLRGSLPPEFGKMSSLARLDLESTGLSGTLPEDFYDLANLAECWLGRTKFSGTLSESIGRLSALSRFNAEHTSFRGTLPKVVYNLTGLTQLLLSSTEISGTISDSVSQLTRLTHMRFRSARLQGTLPSALGLLRNLIMLDLDACAIQGTIPESFWDISSMQVIYLGQTQISGTISSAIGRLSSLRRLVVYRTKLHGRIPVELEKLPLSEIEMSDNQHTGTIPPQLGSCSKLTRLRIRNNQFTGTLPPELGNATALTYISISENKLQGSIPPEFGRLTSISQFYVMGNNFQGQPTIPPNARVVDIGENPHLSGALPWLPRLETLAARNCSFSSVEQISEGVQSIDLAHNMLEELSPAFYNLPKVTTLNLNGNKIRSWPPKGIYNGAQLNSGVPACGAELIEEPFVWPELQSIDVSDNPLDVDAYSFLGTLFWSRLLANLRARNSKLKGSMITRTFASNMGTTLCSGVAPFEDAFPRLVLMDIGQNELQRIGSPDLKGNEGSITPKDFPQLTTALFDANHLTFVQRAWFNEGDLGSHSSMRELNVSANPGLHFEVLPATSLCGPGTVAAPLSTNPESFAHSISGSAAVECGKPCPPNGMRLDTDAGTPDEGGMCRCAEGYGMLPEDCFDAHWRDSAGRSCQDHTQNGTCSAEASAACCACGGHGGGANGRHCSECPADTYYFSPDRYRVRSECRHCPSGSSTPVGGGLRTSVCACQCQKGTYLSAGHKCGQTREGLFATGESWDGLETCSSCGFLKTTDRIGSLTKEACHCDIQGIPGLQEDAGVCGCQRKFFLNHQLLQCQECAEDGEACEWNHLSDSLLPPKLMKGFWATTGWIGAPNVSSSAMSGFAGHSIYKCFSERTCIDEFGNCAYGREGVACSLCQPGRYGGPDGECETCEGSWAFAFIFVVVPFLILPAHLLLEAGDSAKNRNVFILLRSFRVSLAQLVQHLQVMTVVGTFTVGWPLDVESVFRSLSITNFRLLQSTGIACLAHQQSASLELGARYLVPVVLAAIGIFVSPLLAALVSRVLHALPWSRAHRLARRLRMRLADSAKAVFWCGMLFFASLLQNGLILFTCLHNPNGERTVHEYPHLRCAKDHEWLQLAGPGIIYIVLLVCIALGCFIMGLMKVSKHMEENDFESRGHLNFMFENFRHATIHWSIVLLCRDIFVNIVGAALASYGSWQLLVTASGSLILGIACLQQSPYYDVSNTVMEILNAVSVFTICAFTAGMGFGQTPGFQDVMALHENSEEHDEVLTRGRILLILQLISIFGPIFILLYQLLLLVPFVQRHLPMAVRPLKASEEQQLRDYLKYELRITQNVKLAQLVDRMDQRELIHFCDFICRLPISKKVLWEEGHSGSKAYAKVTTLIHRANTLTLESESSPRRTSIDDLLQPDSPAGSPTNQESRSGSRSGNRSQTIIGKKEIDVEEANTNSRGLSVAIL